MTSWTICSYGHKTSLITRASFLRESRLAIEWASKVIARLTFCCQSAKVGSEDHLGIVSILQPCQDCEKPCVRPCYVPLQAECLGCLKELALFHPSTSTCSRFFPMSSRMLRCYSSSEKSTIGNHGQRGERFSPSCKLSRHKYSGDSAQTAPSISQLSECEWRIAYVV